MPTSTKSVIWRPYTQEGMATPPIAIERAEGAYLYTRDGQRLFDGISSWWVITHGHCHPRIVEAIQTQAARVDQVIFANFTHAPAEQLAEKLIRVAPAKSKHVFFSDNGSTAVESALKMTLQACAQRGQPEKTQFVAFAKAYHGDTVGAMSVGGDGIFTRPYRPTLFSIHRAQQPENASADVDAYVSDFARILEQHHSTIAGVILEPLLQAAAGMVVWRKEAVQKVADLCRRYKVYLIFDEVMTGFGRTGSLFATDQLGVEPDLICLSKGLTGGALPLAVTLSSDDIYQAFLSNDKAKMFFHGHSFTGNPIACAAASASLDLFSSESTLHRIAQIETVQREQLQRLADRQAIQNARICGTMAAFEVTTKKVGYGSAISENITQTAIKHGLFIRPLGNTVYLLPPYCSTREDLEQAWNVIERTLQEFE